MIKCNGTRCDGVIGPTSRFNFYSYDCAMITVREKTSDCLKDKDAFESTLHNLKKASAHGSHAAHRV